MKILLFNLGPIEDRIIAWGIEGFKSLFEQDIILWGPIPDTNFSYKGKEIPIVKFFEPTTITDIFKKLPDGWFPDVVVCETSIINYIPDIYKCPVKTILFTRDAWSDTIFNRQLVEFFDFLSHAAIDRSLYYDLHINILPLSNFAVSCPPPDSIMPEFEKRNIDVIAIANYNNSFYHERYKAFYNLSQLSKSDLKIKFYSGIKRSEIYRYYQRSKIMIDWAHTLSNRSYEAALNGCLLFSHKDNPLIKEFWEPWEEYIPYDENNIIELSSYYISNPDHAKRIINKAKDKIQKTASSWGEYVWENIKIANNRTFSIQERTKHIESIPLSDSGYRAATPLVYNYDYNTNYPSDWKEIYFTRIDNLLSKSKADNSKILPLIEAGRLSFLLKKYELSLKYLEELENILPEYAWIYYLKGRIYWERNENDQALSCAKKAIDCSLRSPELLQQFVLPLIEKGNSCDGRRITNYMWQSVYGHINEFQENSLLHLAFELSGNIYHHIGNKGEAVIAYKEAINYVPIPDCIYKLNELLIESMEFETLLEVTDKGIKNSQYDSILILYKAYALIKLNQKKHAIKILKEHKRVLKHFEGVRKIFLIRNSINIINGFLMLNKQLSSKIIIELIRTLKQKLGLTYFGKGS
jgi:tetratricopeptide (TPR) repeat protein